MRSEAAGTFVKRFFKNAQTVDHTDIQLISCYALSIKDYSHYVEFC